MTGAPIRVKVGHTNTGAATLNLNGLGAANIVNPDGSALSAGQLVSGMIAEVVFGGTNFQLVDAYFQVIHTANTWSATQTFSASVVAQIVQSTGTGLTLIGGSTGTNITNHANTAINVGVADNGNVTVRGVVSAPNGTTGTQVVNISQFPSFLAVNGWKKYPDPNVASGYLIEQWGSATVPASFGTTSSVAVTFPIAFPNGIVSITGAPTSVANAAGAGGNPSFAAQSVSLGGFSLALDVLGYTTFQNTVTAYWRAIGF
jgi:hypothetical protein